MKLVLVAVGTRLPAWADAAFAEYAKRFPPELRLELKAVKAEPSNAAAVYCKTAGVPQGCIVRPTGPVVRPVYPVAPVTVAHVGYTRVTPYGVRHVGYTRVRR